ncbi:MAG: RNA polymerase factor sigma-54 [Proteobacteria bacterium]|jgi:RNA polymerase sigma-54 factor|nr:RNA polymerase factor sigma-54 [Pseudomonadota bacterium]
MNLSQTLRMTPQLQQAIKLLQMSRLEMETQVRKELDENPILEEAQELKEEDLQRTKEAADTVETPAESQDQDPQKHDEFEWESYLENQQKPPQQNFGGNEEIMNYENVISTTESLYDHLLWQAKMNGFNEEEMVQAEILINYIDDDGYITTPLEEIAATESTTKEELEGTLKFIHEFDPPGVGARNLQECLLIQAKFLEEDTNDLVHLIAHHIKDLEKKNYEGIAKAMGRDIREIAEMCKIIYSMDPKPGRAYAPADTQYVTPDVYVYKVGDDYMVSLNEDGLPRLKISNFYKNMLKQSGNEKTQEYIQEKLRSAVWLIKSIHQRQRTIYKVTDSIVKHQRDFFDKGAAFIKPMVLRDIAADIGMHESTVSRVTTAKYVHTPQGIFELKYFFNSGINTTDGESLASESVKLKIKELIAKEDPKSPYSDQQIVELLLKDGIEIARRTVAKYRDVLKILPSSRRKKIF